MNSYIDHIIGLRRNKRIRVLNTYFYEKIDRMTNGQGTLLDALKIWKKTINVGIFFNIINYIIVKFNESNSRKMKYPKETLIKSLFLSI